MCKCYLLSYRDKNVLDYLDNLLVVICTFSGNNLFAVVLNDKPVRLNKR